MLHALLLLLPIVPAAAQDDAPFPLDAASLGSLADACAAAVGEATEVDVTDALPVAVVSRKELFAVVYGEQKEILGGAMRAVLGGTDAMQAEALRQAREQSGAYVAKLDLRDGRLLLCAENLAASARALGTPVLSTREGLGGLLLHELVHAADRHRFDLLARFRACDSWQAVQAVGAVVEGHAELVSRAVAARLGWAATQARADAAMNARRAPPRDTLARAARLFPGRGAVAYGLTYVDGPVFVQAVQDAEGDAGVVRLLEEPPHDVTLVLEPAWYLDPASRPAPTHDLDGGLDRIARTFASDDWTGGRADVAPVEVARAVADAVGAARAATLRRGLVRARVVELAARRGPARATVLLASYRDEASARAHLELFGACHRAVAARPGTGVPLAVEVSDPTPFGDPAAGVRGLRVESSLRVPGAAAPARAVCALRGTVAVEAALLGPGPDGAALEALAGDVLAHATALPGPAEGR